MTVPAYPQPSQKRRTARANSLMAQPRDVKSNAAVFSTQLHTLKGQPPQRDPDSTTYVASFDESVDFGGMIRQEAMLRGMAHAKQVVVLGDGAAWIWEVARINFPDAVWICITPLSMLTRWPPPSNGRGGASELGI